MNQHDQMMREALESIETILENAYHRHFAECCGRGQVECCGDFIEQWSQEDRKILDTLSPIQRKLSQALAAPPAAQINQQLVKSLEYAMWVIDGMEQIYGNLWQLDETPESIDLLLTKIRVALAAAKKGV